MSFRFPCRGKHQGVQFSLAELRRRRLIGPKLAELEGNFLSLMPVELSREEILHEERAFNGNLLNRVFCSLIAGAQLLEVIAEQKI